MSACIHLPLEKQSSFENKLKKPLCSLDGLIWLEANVQIYLYALSCTVDFCTGNFILSFLITMSKCHP